MLLNSKNKELLASIAELPLAFKGVGLGMYNDKFFYSLVFQRSDIPEEDIKESDYSQILITPESGNELLAGLETVRISMQSYKGK